MSKEQLCSLCERMIHRPECPRALGTVDAERVWALGYRAGYEGHSTMKSLEDNPTYMLAYRRGGAVAKLVEGRRPECCFCGQDLGHRKHRPGCPDEVGTDEAMKEWSCGLEDGMNGERSPTASKSYALGLFQGQKITARAELEAERMAEMERKF